jgi:anti-anti-sigma factor
MALGDVDVATADQLRKVLTSILASGQVRRLIVDLSGVAFLDAHGVSVLLAAYHRGVRDGTTVVVTHCRSTPMRILRITELDKILVRPPPTSRPAHRRAPGKAPGTVPAHVSAIPVIAIPHHPGHPAAGLSSPPDA